MTAAKGHRARVQGRGSPRRDAHRRPHNDQPHGPKQHSWFREQAHHADTVKTTFQANGKDIAKAQAAGNAELYVEPLNASKKNFKTTVEAPRFDCDFFATGNNV